MTTVVDLGTERHPLTREQEDVVLEWQKEAYQLWADLRALQALLLGLADAAGLPLEHQDDAEAALRIVERLHDRAKAHGNALESHWLHHPMGGADRTGVVGHIALAEETALPQGAQ